MMKTKNTIIAENIRNLIYRSGHTQNEIADYLGINPKTFSTYVTGRNNPPFANLKKVADYFHVSVEELVTDNLVKENPRKAFSDLFEMLDESDRECIIYQIKGILMSDKYSKKEVSRNA